jgi:hypothetical protein
MPIWDKLRRFHDGKLSDRNEPLPTNSLLSDIEIIPEKLSARVFIHNLSVGPNKNLSCWTYVSNGLLAYGQEEVIFTLRRDNRELVQPFPDQPLKLFSTIHDFAQEGKIVRAGGVTQFNSSDFFGHHLVYIDPQPLAGITLPERAVTALLVTEEEVVAAQEFGITRLIACLGRQSSHYPCPHWSDRSRQGISFSGTRQQSILSKLQRVYGGKIRVLKEGESIFVTIPPTEAECIRKLSGLPTDMPVALLTSLDPHANACLTWEPAQKGPAAITPPQSDGSRLSGCFLALVPEQDKDGAQIFEDGFVLMLTNLSRKYFTDALLHGKAITFPGQEGLLSARFEWLEQVYNNPVDKVSLTVPGGWWEVYRPESARPSEPLDAAKILRIVLLAPEREFATNIAMEDLTRFITDIEVWIQKICIRAETSFELLVQCTLNPFAQPIIQIATKSENEQDVEYPPLIKDLYEALGTIEPLNTSRNSVTFHMHFAVSPVAGRS